MTAPAIPGTALAVIHNPQLQGDRERHRITVVCSCCPTAILGVLAEDAWTSSLVLDLEAQHVAAIEEHIAIIGQKRGRTWAHHALARKIKGVRA